MANLMKQEIKRVFLMLLEERPINQITVKDIVKECGINRNTFYYHYADLPALVEELIDDEIGRFVREEKSFSSVRKSKLKTLLKKKRNVLECAMSTNAGLAVH